MTIYEYDEAKDFSVEWYTDFVGVIYAEVMTGIEISYHVQGRAHEPPEEWFCTIYTLSVDRRSTENVAYKGNLSKLQAYDEVSRAINVVKGFERLRWVMEDLRSWETSPESANYNAALIQEALEALGVKIIDEEEDDGAS